VQVAYSTLKRTQKNKNQMQMTQDPGKQAAKSTILTKTTKPRQSLEISINCIWWL